MKNRKKPRPALLGTALAAGVVGALAAEPARAGGTADPRAWLGTLSGWLDGNAPYPRAASAPEILIVSAAEAARLHGAEDRHGGKRLRGLYDDATETIYLVAPWSPANPRDVSVLLHELVHHRQAQGGHWYCEQAQEWDAYTLQAEWLTEHGLEPGFYWPAIALASSCTRRDIHP